jgi:hypothetical protein
MALLDIPLGQIAQNDLQRLVDTGAAESLYIDYKQQTYGSAESDHVEYLADISSFTNTAGGDVVIGMTEANGIPTGFSPFRGDIDDEKRRLEAIARTGLDPRINDLQVSGVPISSGGHIIIVRIPRSYRPPHRVIYKGRNRFSARASSGKYEPNVEELRSLFNDGQQVADRIRSFRIDRIAKITAGESSIPLSKNGIVVLHVVPVPSFTDNRLIDIVSRVLSGTHVPLPLGEFGGVNQTSVNLDGFVNYSASLNRVSYAQFFRSGAIEGAAELNLNDAREPYFVGHLLAKMVIAAIKQYLGVLESFNAGLPVYAMLSLCNSKNAWLRHSSSFGSYEDCGPLGRTVATFSEVLISSFDVDVPTTMRPVFNMLWNAFGLIQCESYDAEGNWTNKA